MTTPTFVNTVLGREVPGPRPGPGELPRTGGGPSGDGFVLSLAGLAAGAVLLAAISLTARRRRS
ncbi:MAG: hypothetical protein WEB52_07425 [Dehalococcoidia bacterium]